VVSLAWRRDGGTLLVCGGGRLPDSIRDRFFELAGGSQARIVVFPSGLLIDDDGDRLLDVWRARGAASVQLLPSLSLTQGHDPELRRALAEATGVWISGGSQVWLARTLVGPEMEQALRHILARGGVIGGSSAGAAAMSRVMIAGGRQEEAVLDRGFDLLPGAVIDQHFLRRNRVKRLMTVLGAHPELTGFGIDERTALMVDVRSRRLRVLGDSYVLACVAKDGGGLPRIEILKSGDETDLESLRRPDAMITSSIDLDELVAQGH
jgi:cyanophycinase